MRIVFLFLLFAFNTSVFGQNGTYVDAKPRLELTCPDAMVAEGDEFSVRARFGPVKTGTPEISVRAEIEGATIHVRLEIGGGPFWFEPLVESCTTAVSIRPNARSLSEFGTKNVGYVELKFDELFDELWNDPTAISMIAISAPSRKEHVRLKRWALSLVKRRDFDASRLKFVENGKGPAATFRIWVVPAGADFPI